MGIYNYTVKDFLKIFIDGTLFLWYNPSLR